MPSKPPEFPFSYARKFSKPVEFKAGMKPRAKPRQLEHAEQMAVIVWAKNSEWRWPQLATLYAIPNGGHRAWNEAKKLKREGVRAGQPDLCLPIPMGNYHSLYIEMKSMTGSASKEQKEKHELLRKYGNAVVVCRGHEAAEKVLLSYLRKGVAYVGE